MHFSFICSDNCLWLFKQHKKNEHIEQILMDQPMEQMD